MDEIFIINYEGEGAIAACSTLEKAKLYIPPRDKRYTIHRQIVDAEFKNFESGKKYFCVNLRASTGGLISSFVMGGEYWMNDIFIPVFIESDVFEFRLWAKNKKEAISFSREWRVGLLKGTIDENRQPSEEKNDSKYTF